jgi:peptidoglycan/LPS O-acetylase OafA/YrhL
VDIFFVISGYLLTNIYYSNINFSFISFFTKRAFRIVPSILALVFLLSIIFFFFLYPSDYYDFAKSAFSCLIFLSNFYYFFTENYFDNYNKISLLHTWSVSLEIQLYLIFALTIYYFKKRSVYIFLILGFLSFIFFILDNNARSYYLLTTHSWPFFIGCLIYFARLDLKKKSKIFILVVLLGFDNIYFFSYRFNYIL